MRLPRCLLVLAIVLVGCPEQPPEVPRSRAQTSTPASEGEPCAVGYKVVRTCGPGLACTEMPVAPADPNGKQVLSPQGGGCGGVGGIPCGAGSRVS